MIIFHKSPNILVFVIRIGYVITSISLYHIYRFYHHHHWRAFDVTEIYIGIYIYIYQTFPNANEERKSYLLKMNFNIDVGLMWLSQPKIEINSLLSWEFLHNTGRENENKIVESFASCCVGSCRGRENMSSK